MLDYVLLCDVLFPICRHNYRENNDRLARTPIDFLSVTESSRRCMLYVRKFVGYESEEDLGARRRDSDCLRLIIGWSEDHRFIEITSLHIPGNRPLPMTACIAYIQ